MTASMTRPDARTAKAAAPVLGTRPDIASHLPAVEVAAVTSGVATKYWDECVVYPSGNPPRLWLYVSNAWKSLDNPSQGIRDMVQRAFLGSGSNVRVWYDNSTIVGIVVEGT
ncbi:MAG: hypothetical protein ACE5PV_25650 [Candidatus Poribacteria bacterium]